MKCNKSKISLKLICQQNWNVPELKCQQNWNYTQKNWNVIKSYITPKQKMLPNLKFYYTWNTLKITEIVRVMTRFVFYTTEFVIYNPEDRH